MSLVCFPNSRPGNETACLLNRSGSGTSGGTTAGAASVFGRPSSNHVVLVLAMHVVLKYLLTI